MGRSELHRRYYDQKRVGSYGGVAALQRVVPAERDVERWLSMQDAYTLHKPVKRPRPPPARDHHAQDDGTSRYICPNLFIYFYLFIFI